MRVLLDGVHLVPPIRGTGHYMFRTLEELERCQPKLDLTVLVRKGTRMVQLPELSRVRWIEVPWAGRAWHGLRTLPWHTKRESPDVVLIPYPGVVSAPGRPYTMICHQTLEGGRGPLGRLHQSLLAETLRRAEVVFTPSVSVSSWLRRVACVERRRLQIAPAAPCADFFTLRRNVNVPATRADLRSSAGYVLTFWSSAAQNLSLVLEAYDRVAEAGLPHALVIAGVEPSERRHVETALRAYRWLDRVRVVNHLGRERLSSLASLLSSASAYLEPAPADTFGIKVLEAMAAGAPVVASRSGALPEVGGTAALFFNPLDPADAGSTLIRVLSDPKVSSAAVREGWSVSNRFTWRRTARIVHAALVHIAQRRRAAIQDARRARAQLARPRADVAVRAALEPSTTFKGGANRTSELTWGGSDAAAEQRPNHT